MKALMDVGFLIALPSLLLGATNARADWLLTYDVAVSSLPNGPFKPSATLWTQNVALPNTPGSIVLSANTYNGEELTPFGYTHRLATITAFSGTNPPASVFNVPYFIKLTMHDPSSNQSGSLILSSALNSPIYPAVFTTTPPNFASLVTIGNYMYSAVITPLPPPPPAPPGGPGAPAGEGVAWSEQFEVLAHVERNGIPESPEPSSLFIACQCLLGCGLLVHGRCRWMLKKLV